MTEALTREISQDLGRTWVGLPLNRVEGRAKVTGAATYAAEFNVPGAAHAVIVGAAISAGVVRAIDVSAALAAPGVIAVLTHANFPKLNEALVALKVSGERNRLQGSAGQQLLPMQGPEIHYAGQPVAVVVAEQLEQAAFAARLVGVEYLPATPKVSLDAHLGEAFAPQNVWGEKTDAVRGDPAAAFDVAAVKVDQVYYTALQHHVTMEPHATVAQWDAADHVTIYEPTTWVYGVRKTVATWFGLNEGQVRVRQQFVGGSFGAKGPTWPHVAVAVAAARAVGRPVKLVLTRPQTFVSNGYRPRIRHEVALAASGDGRLTAMRYAATATTSRFDDRVVAPTTKTPPHLYACPNVETHYRLVGLNRNGPFTMRTPGEAPGLFAVESAMDELAYALNLDPVELRLRNDAPTTDPHTGTPWSSRHLRECFERAAARFGWSRRDPTPRSRREGDWLVGWGCASMAYDARSSPAKASIVLRDDGTVVLKTATTDQGTGSYTVMRQLAADVLGVPPTRIEFEIGDTDLPMAPISAGSQTTASVGTAVASAARNLRQKLRSLFPADAGHVPWDALLRRDKLPQVAADGHAEKLDEIEGVARYSFGAHFAEVRVNVVTGEVRVGRYVGAFAAGRIVNPKTAHSQLVGGIVWGIGQALTEQTHVDPVTGRYVNDDLAEYLVPTHADVPGTIDAFFVDERDDLVNPIGVKGVGEIGTIGGAAAIANAVFHATGRRVRDLPITPDKLL